MTNGDPNKRTQSVLSHPFEISFLLWVAALFGLSCASSPVLPDDPTSSTRRAPEDPSSRELPQPDAIPVAFLYSEPIPLPFGARQLEEKYWLGAMIGPNDIPALKNMGIRVVISAAEPAGKTIYLLSEAGIHHISVPIGTTFRHADRILQVTQQYSPSQIYIHCTHGADRTGVIAAYLLVMRHKWPIGDAFYSVLCPCEEDIEGLQDTLREFCIDDRRAPDDPSVGFYSLSRAGQDGGLKVRNRRYERLVRTTLEQMITPMTNGMCDRP